MQLHPQNGEADYPKWEAASPIDTYTNTRERTKENTVKKKEVVLPFDSKVLGSMAKLEGLQARRARLQVQEPGQRAGKPPPTTKPLRRRRTNRRSYNRAEPRQRVARFPTQNQHNESRANRGPSDGSLLTAHLQLANDSGESLAEGTNVLASYRVNPAAPRPHFSSCSRTRSTTSSVRRPSR